MVTKRSKKQGHLHSFGIQCQKCLTDHPEDHAPRPRLPYKIRRRAPLGSIRDQLRKELQKCNT